MPHAIVMPNAKDRQNKAIYMQRKKQIHTENPPIGTKNKKTPSRYTLKENELWHITDTVLEIEQTTNKTGTQTTPENNTETHEYQRPKCIYKGQGGWSLANHRGAKPRCKLRWHHDKEKGWNVQKKKGAGRLSNTAQKERKLTITTATITKKSTKYTKKSQHRMRREDENNYKQVRPRDIFT